MKYCSIVAIACLFLVSELAYAIDAKPKCSDLAPKNYPSNPDPFAEAIPNQITQHYKYQAVVSDPSTCTMANFEPLSCRFKFPVQEDERRTCQKFLMFGAGNLTGDDYNYYSATTIKAVKNYQNARSIYEEECIRLSYRIDPKGACSFSEESKPCGIGSAKMIDSRCTADVTCKVLWSCEPLKKSSTGGNLTW